MQCLHHNHSLFLLPVQVGIFPVSTWSGFKFSPMSLPPFHYLLEAAQTKFRNLGSTACIPSYKTCAYFFPPSRHQTITPPSARLLSLLPGISWWNDIPTSELNCLYEKLFSPRDTSYPPLSIPASLLTLFIPLSCARTTTFFYCEATAVIWK